jgi:hypothetical protein
LTFIRDDYPQDSPTDYHWGPPDIFDYHKPEQSEIARSFEYLGSRHTQPIAVVLAKLKDRVFATELETVLRSERRTESLFTGAATDIVSNDRWAKLTKLAAGRILIDDVRKQVTSWIRSICPDSEHILSEDELQAMGSLADWLLSSIDLKTQNWSGVRRKLSNPDCKSFPYFGDDFKADLTK